MPDRESFDILIIAPLEEEAKEILKVFPLLADRTSDDTGIYSVETGHADITAMLVQLPEYGKQQAFRTTQTLLSRYDFGVVACVGIAGRLSSDLRLGDVCYTGSVLDIYERQKFSDAPNKSGMELKLSPIPYRTANSLAAKLNFLRANPSLAKFYKGWQEQCGATLQSHLPDVIDGASGREAFRDAPQTFVGAIVCGAVSTSEKYNDLLKALDRKVLAIETESGGIFAAAEEAGKQAFTIRGISDYADADKSALEEATRGVARAVAAHNAATFLRSQISNPFFKNHLISLRANKGSTALDVQQAKAVADDIVSATLQLVDVEIEENLKALAPESHLQDKRYKLPPPRIKPVALNDDPRKMGGQRVLELHELLIDHRIAHVRIPLDYPDQSLPWVFADTLAGEMINNLQIVPIVVEGSRIRPPRQDIRAAVLQFKLDELARNPGAQVVFIIGEPPINSVTKIKFLAKEIEAFPNAKFITISRAAGKIGVEDTFAQTVGAKLFQLCDVPFFAVSQFLQRKFDMSAAEAEVIAYRLNATFSRFELSAHPSYFAGIPRETLAALAQVNRRAELIQLAVDGFLTFVVAQDEGDLLLSRTTRARYLSELAIRLEVEKESFSEPQLIEFTKDYFSRYDFAADPIAFVASFQNKGLIRFEDRGVHFSLPFVKSYLLASALAKNEKLASRYFALNQDDFDLETFDLYAELGAAESTVQAVLDRLRSHEASLRNSASADEILLTDQIRPAILTHSHEMNRIKTSLQNWITRLGKATDNGREKQRIIDLADTTTEKAGKRASIAPPSTSETKPEQQTETDLTSAIRDWVIASTLLGSAAEQLPAKIKQELAALLISVATLIVDSWTRKRAKVDFRALKRELMATKQVEDFFAEHAEGPDKDKAKELFGFLVDLLELHFMAEPVNKVLSHLCERSGHKVLARSIEQVNSKEGVAALLQYSWLADFNSKMGVPGLRKAFAKMPNAQFLRIVLATHFLGRVYWAHFSPEDRRALLEAADEALEGTPARMIEKGKILRSIDKKSGAGKT